MDSNSGSLISFFSQSDQNEMTKIMLKHFNSSPLLQLLLILKVWLQYQNGAKFWKFKLKVDTHEESGQREPSPFV